MGKEIQISSRPTFDLTELKLLDIDIVNRLAYFQSAQVFYFDKVFGTLENRSRVIRLGKPENELVEQVISATIDAGYCGQLVWKTKLTFAGANLLQSGDNPERLAQLFAGAQQLHLLPSPASNYYNGTNQTQLEPDIIFLP